MPVAWIAQVVFFGSYFIAWVANQLPHVLWITVSAIAALVVALCLLFENRGALLQDRQVKC